MRRGQDGIHGKGAVLTGGCKGDGHLERLALNDVSARAGPAGGETAGDGVDAMEGAGEDEVLIGRELGKALCDAASD